MCIASELPKPLSLCNTLTLSISLRTSLPVNVLDLVLVPVRVPVPVWFAILAGNLADIDLRSLRCDLIEFWCQLRDSDTLEVEVELEVDIEAAVVVEVDDDDRLLSDDANPPSPPPPFPPLSPLLVISTELWTNTFDLLSIDCDRLRRLATDESSHTQGPPRKSYVQRSPTTVPTQYGAFECWSISKVKSWTPSTAPLSPFEE